MKVDSRLRGNDGCAGLVYGAGFRRWAVKQAVFSFYKAYLVLIGNGGWFIPTGVGNIFKECIP